MPNVEVRWAAINDFSDVAELDRSSWRDNRNSEFIPDGEHVWRIWIEHAYVCVAIEEDNIVGATLSVPSTKSDIHFVHKIFITVEYRGLGVGKKLLNKLCRKYDENNITAYLTTDTNNQAMQRLAEVAGFSERELVRGYNRKDGDRWLYKRV